MPFDESHVDEETLALLALGEPAASEAELAHLATCPVCTEQLDGLRDVVGLARAAGPEPLVAPPDAVWQRISDDLGLAAPAPAPTATSRSADTIGTTGSTGTTATIVPLDSRRRGGGRRWAWVAGAAAAGVVLGGLGTWAVLRGDDTPTVVATATLEPLPGWDASGTAEVETTADGARVLVVDLGDTDVSTDGFREVWLLTPDVSGLISVGTLEGTSGRFDLPDGLDLDEFSVVDVSEEQFDGNPAHSGDSIVRGPLGA